MGQNCGRTAGSRTEKASGTWQASRGYAIVFITQPSKQPRLPAAIEWRLVVHTVFAYVSSAEKKVVPLRRYVWHESSFRR